MASSGRIPKEFIQELTNRLSIVTVLDTFLPSDKKLKKIGENFGCPCPFHEEKTASFVANEKKEIVTCFGGCDLGGGKSSTDAIGITMKLGGYSFNDAVDQLASMAGMEVPRKPMTNEQRNRTTEADQIISANTDAAEFYFTRLGDKAINADAVSYLKKRGFDGVTAKSFNIGYAAGRNPDELFQALKGKHSPDILIKAGLVKKNTAGGSHTHYDVFRERIMFPIQNQKGKTVGFGGRLIANRPKLAKYTNTQDTPVFKKGEIIYNLNKAHQAIRRQGEALVVEGYMDVAAMGQFGIDNATAALGTALTEKHISQLLKSTDNLTFVFDGDNAGRQAAWKAMTKSLGFVEDGVQLKFVFNPEGEDPDSMIRKEGVDAYRQRLSAALPLSSYIVEEVQRRHPENTPEGKALRVKDATEALGAMPAGVYRYLLIQKLGENIGIEPAKLESLITGKPEVPLVGRPKVVQTVTPPAQTNKMSGMHFTGGDFAGSFGSPKVMMDRNYKQFLLTNAPQIESFKQSFDVKQLAQSIIPATVSQRNGKVNIQQLSDNLVEVVKEYGGDKINIKQASSSIHQYAGKVIDSYLEQLAAQKQIKTATVDGRPTPPRTHAGGPQR